MRVHYWYRGGWATTSKIEHGIRWGRRRKFDYDLFHEIKEFRYSEFYEKEYHYDGNGHHASTRTRGGNWRDSWTFALCAICGEWEILQRNMGFGFSYPVTPCDCHSGLECAQGQGYDMSQRRH